MVVDEFLPEDCYAICAPDGPGTPFALPDLVWLDAFRVVVMIMGLTLIVLTPRLVMRAEAFGQQCRLAGQGVFAAIVIGTEVDHIGDYANYRLGLSFFGISLMLYGVYRMQFEIAPKTRAEHRVSE